MDDDSNNQQTADSKKQSKWCVDDSATERVFIPDGKGALRRLLPAFFVCPAGLLASPCFERGVAHQQRRTRETETTRR